MASDASHWGAEPAACSSTALPGICKHAQPLEKNLGVKHLILGNVWTSVRRWLSSVPDEEAGECLSDSGIPYICMIRMH